ncbi:MAG: hypothetical protein JWQ03_930 [Variovorax sp.]|nr:hypothetical protein [Variovorax sp.]
MAFVVFVVLFVIPLWRICSRAGFNPALSLLVIIPLVGSIVLAALLSFREWPQPSIASREP